MGEKYICTITEFTAKIDPSYQTAFSRLNAIFKEPVRPTSIF